jgi:hypothetical protein
MRDLVGGVGDSATPVGWGSVEELPSLGCSVRLVPAWPLAQSGGRVEDQGWVSIAREPRARVSPRVSSRAEGMLGFRLILGHKVHTSILLVFINTHRKDLQAHGYRCSFYSEVLNIVSTGKRVSTTKSMLNP